MTRPDPRWEAFAARDYLMVIAFINSVILTVASVALLVILSAMVAYVWQRRASRLSQRWFDSSLSSAGGMRPFEGSAAARTSVGD